MANYAKAENQRKREEEWLEDSNKHFQNEKTLVANYTSDKRVEAKRIARIQLETDREQRAEKEKMEVK
jgi:hypothetical protein